jgi:hypothetical protein
MLGRKIAVNVSIRTFAPRAKPAACIEPEPDVILSLSPQRGEGRGEGWKDGGIGERLVVSVLSLWCRCPLALLESRSWRGPAFRSAFDHFTRITNTTS